MDKSNNQQNQNALPKAQPVTVRAGGVESAGASVEFGGGRATESGGEQLGKSEQAKEMQGERRKEQLFERAQRHKSNQSQKKQKQQIKLPATPKVFGYKIPPKLIQNYKKIQKSVGKGDPQTGIACLYIFVERLLRMQS